LGNARVEATVLQFAGIGHRELGNHDLSERLLDQSLAIARRHRDTYTEVLTLLALARLHLGRDDDRARDGAERSVALSREHGMRHHLAEALHLLGECELSRGRPERAIVHLEESVAIWRTRGWPSLQAAALVSLGRAYAERDPEAAERAFAEARDLGAETAEKQAAGPR